MIVLIDNYDSFTYNLVQYLGQLSAETQIYRNDKITVKEAINLKPDGIVISPGPSDPNHAGICLPLIQAAAEHNIPIFGVCLGHQSIAQSFGGKIVRCDKLMHGKISNITHKGTGIFHNVPSPVSVARYHSLTVEPNSLPKCLTITAQSQDNTIMALSHKTKPIHSVQFHPESIATEHGHTMLKNFLEIIK